MAGMFGKVAIIGAGAMGRGIAQVMARAGAQVALIDADAEVAGAAREAVAASLSRAAQKGRLSQEAADAARDRIAASGAIADAAGAGLVIEAVVERMDVKAPLFADLARIAPEAVLASNTSALGIGALAEAAGLPGRLVGLHFFNPAHVMKLVEVVLPAATPPALRDRLVAAMQAAGKVPVISADTPGFIVNRCARPFYGEALAMLAEGPHSAAEIDAAMTAAGYRLGPFALIDMVGADVNLAATEGVAAGLGQHPRYHVFAPLREAVAAGRLGQKAGAGFVTPAPETATPPPADAAGIVARIEAMLVNEACFLWQDGIAAPDDIDTALKLGLNFPRGPFEIAAGMGAARIRAILSDVQVRAPAALRARYAPADALARLADAPPSEER